MLQLNRAGGKPFVAIAGRKQALIPPTNATHLRTLLAVILAISLGALASAFAGQYLFGLVPCVLCLFQRVPWAVAGVISALALAGRAGRGRLLPLALCAGVFAAGGTLAFYHVGVEQHWWGSIAGCGGGPVSGLTLDDLRPEELASGLKPCDQVDWRLFGLSLAGYNAIASGLLSVCCMIGLFLLRRKPVP